jgi:hypothetical protein
MPDFSLAHRNRSRPPPDLNCAKSGDWSIFRPEEASFAKSLGRKHGPVPFAQDFALLPGSRPQLPGGADITVCRLAGKNHCSRNLSRQVGWPTSNVAARRPQYPLSVATPQRLRKIVTCSERPPRRSAVIGTEAVPYKTLLARHYASCLGRRNGDPGRHSFAKQHATEIRRSPARKEQRPWVTKNKNRAIAIDGPFRSTSTFE